MRLGDAAAELRQAAALSGERARWSMEQGRVARAEIEAREGASLALAARACDIARARGEDWYWGLDD